MPTGPSLLAAVALLAGAGCGGPTTLLMELELAGGFPQPDSVRVSLFAAGRLAAPSTLPVASAGKQLPGNLLVSSIDASAPDFRVLIDGLDSLGNLTAQTASRVRLTAGVQTRVRLTLDHLLADSDGDGVPDNIDDCPLIYDPDQRCDALADGGIDAAIDAAVSPPDGGGLHCPSFALFCDDFETGDQSRWSSLSDNNARVSVTVGRSMPFRGQFSLDVTAQSNLDTDAGTSMAMAGYLQKDLVLGAPASAAARAYFFAPVSPGNFGVILALFNNVAGYAVATDQLNRLTITQDQSANPDVRSTVVMPLGRWVCMELLVDYAAPGRVRLFVDGASVIDFQPAVITVPTELDVGLVRAPGMVPGKLWVDDVAFATQRIGCE